MHHLQFLLPLSGVLLAGAAAFLAVWFAPLADRIKTWLFVSAALGMLALENTDQLLIHSGIVSLGTMDPLSTVDKLQVLMGALLLSGIIFSRAALREPNVTLEMLADQIRRLRHASVKADGAVTASELNTLQASPDSTKAGQHGLE